MRCNNCGWENPEGIHNCEKCGTRLQESSQNYKQCPNGHYYKGDHCPYCSPQRTIIESEPYTAPYTCETCKAWSGEYNGGKCPYCGNRLQGQPEDMFPWWLGNDHETTIIPICKHCGHRIRKSIPYSFIQQYNNIVLPWNHEWDGKCECCGHDYSIYIGTQVLFGQKKRTSVKADSKMIDETDNPDDYRVLSGVTIKTTIVDKAMKDDAYGEVFLTANELKGLINILKDSPLLEQFDYDDSRYI